ncbi:helix-turn-helix domain-containing protein [Moraxella osloensis]|jgi:transcriptional regulator with XRE-family HTH domain|uniref:helix-turn-helix domain-containing protein n=1 Tax=Faucicola osloensis TaxID=34062 RepID=UPI002004ECBE|nr:helix-turn-helix transcriptional regulator [Moraxella osloensis]MCK6053654.1 helix-turn-helix domain-containing protein [Moraxella osloensis]
MIHQALKKIREFHNIKQSELSMRLGISNSYLSEIESGKKSPSLELLDKYSDIFNIPVSSLILFSETLDDEEAKLSKRFKVKSTQLILKILDWSNTIESTKQRKA